MCYKVISNDIEKRLWFMPEERDGSWLAPDSAKVAIKIQLAKNFSNLNF